MVDALNTKDTIIIFMQSIAKLLRRAITTVNSADTAYHEYCLQRHIEDQLYLQMCNSKRIARVNAGTKSERQINWYYHEAAKYAGRISAGNFVRGLNKNLRPVFRIYFSDLQ
jgi:hypothetical protein